MDEMKKTWEQKQAEKAAKVKPIKQMILGECHRIIQLLEDDVDSNTIYGDREVAELFAKMHELRRDTINFEKRIRGN